MMFVFTENDYLDPQISRNHHAPAERAETMVCWFLNSTAVMVDQIWQTKRCVFHMKTTFFPFKRYKLIWEITQISSNIQGFLWIDVLKSILLLVGAKHAWPRDPVEDPVGPWCWLPGQLPSILTWELGRNHIHKCWNNMHPMVATVAAAYNM